MAIKELTKDYPVGDMCAIGDICVIRALNRQVLVDSINQYVKSDFFDGTENRIYLLASLSGEKLGCVGSSLECATEADVPYHSVPCTCSNPKHWLIKYDEEGNSESNKW